LLLLLLLLLLEEGVDIFRLRAEKTMLALA
jgi:hypothetical protein